MYQEIIIQASASGNTNTTTSSPLPHTNTTTNTQTNANTNVSDENATSSGPIGAEATNTTNFLKVSHNSVLNCLFLLTKEHKLIIYDCNSLTKLKEIDWGAAAANANPNSSRATGKHTIHD